MKALSKTSGDGHEQPSDDATEKDNLRAAARRELNNFLSSRGIDPALADNIQIHLKLLKKRRPGTEGETQKSSGYSVTYTSPDGSILASKTDVFNALNSPPSEAARSVSDPEARRSSHESSRDRLDIIQECKPITIDSIKVIEFGEIVELPGLFTPVQIYPVGYKAEVSLNPEANSRGAATVLCEISLVDDSPQFSIKVLKDGPVFVDKTEMGAWKQVVAAAHAYFSPVLLSILFHYYLFQFHCNFFLFSSIICLRTGGRSLSSI